MEIANTLKMRLQEDYNNSMDRVAPLAGMKPSLLSLLSTDPKLAVDGVFGLCTPYQYPQQGLGKWDGVQRTILIQSEWILKPIRTL
ncbi:hypothetical protein EI555_006953, partial [Monodon monoceros]